MSQHRVSPSPFLSSSCHTQRNNTTQSVTLTVTLTSTFYSTLYRYLSQTYCALPKWCVIRKYITLNAFYPPCAEPKAHNSAVGWHWKKQTHKQAFQMWLLFDLIKDCHNIYKWNINTKEPNLIQQSIHKIHSNLREKTQRCYVINAIGSRCVKGIFQESEWKKDRKWRKWHRRDRYWLHFEILQSRVSASF